MRMRKNNIMAGKILMGLLALSAAHFSISTYAAGPLDLPKGFKQLEIGDAAPDFKLPGVVEKTYTLRDFADPDDHRGAERLYDDGRLLREYLHRPGCASALGNRPSGYFTNDRLDTPVPKVIGGLPDAGIGGEGLQQSALP